MCWTFFLIGLFQNHWYQWIGCKHWKLKQSSSCTAWQYFMGKHAFPWYICDLDRELESTYSSKIVSLTAFLVPGQYPLKCLFSHLPNHKSNTSKPISTCILIKYKGVFMNPWAVQVLHFYFEIISVELLWSHWGLVHIFFKV